MPTPRYRLLLAAALPILVGCGGRAPTGPASPGTTVASLRVTPDTADVIGTGDTLRLSARAEDALGQPVPYTGGVRWSVSDSGVASIDTEGLVTAAGTGVTTVTATGESGLSGEATVRVFASGPPSITSVSPLPLREGAEAVVLGSGFRPQLSDDSVTVDGVPARVLAAAPGSLSIRVPTYGCRPSRTVAVEVRTSFDPPASADVRLQGGGTNVSLDVGGRLLVQDSGAFCLQFAARSDSDGYLLGVQATAPSASALVPDALTAVTVTSVPAPSAVAAAASMAAVTPGPRFDRHEGGHHHDDDPQPAASDAERAAQAAAETRLDAWSRENLDPAASIPARRASAARRASRLERIRPAMLGNGPSVGDTLTLRVPDGRASNPCTTFTTIRAVVRVLGTGAILAEDVANPAGGMTLSQYQTLSDRLDGPILATLADYFGRPPDIDGNGRVIAVFTREVNRTWSGATAFVFGGDFYPRSDSAGAFSCPSSDEGEVYYSRAPDPTGVYGTPVTAASLRARAPLIMAHEITHIIQQGHRFSAAAPWMASWMMEGQAVLAQEVVGHAVMGNAPGQDYGLQVAYSHDADGTYWYREPFQGLSDYFGYVSSATRIPDAPAACGWLISDPSPCDGAPAWYAAGWAFLRWLSDRFGPELGGERALQRALIDGDASGFANVEAVVGRPWRELLADWAAALYLDDRVPAVGPDLGLASWDLHGIFDAYGINTGLQPVEEGFGDWTVSQDIRSASSAYFEMTGPGHPGTAVRIGGAPGGVLPPGLQVWVVRLR